MDAIRPLAPMALGHAIGARGGANESDPASLRLVNAGGERRGRYRCRYFVASIVATM